MRQTYSFSKTQFKDIPEIQASSGSDDIFVSVTHPFLPRVGERVHLEFRVNYRKSHSSPQREYRGCANFKVLEVFHFPHEAKVTITVERD